MYEQFLQQKTKTRLILLALMLIGGLFFSSCRVEPEAKVHRVGVLVGIQPVSGVFDGFKAGMTELGYVEGENIVYDVQIADVFDIPTYQSILQKFVDDKVDLIFVCPTEASIEAKIIAEDTGIPVLFDYAFVEGMGIIDSVREPGGNITGVRYPAIDIAVRRLEILHELAPDAAQIMVPYQRGYPIVQPQLDALQPVAEAMGVTLIEAPADNVDELEALLQARVDSGDIGIDAFYFAVEPLAVNPNVFVAVVKFADEYNIPVGGIYNSIDGYESLFGFNVDFVSSGKEAAPLADKIFQGIPAGTIPVVSAEAYMEINYRKAEAQGLTVPEGLLSLADNIIR